MRRNVNYTCHGNVNNEFQKSKKENKKMIIKHLRFHPEGQSMHYIMLVRGKNTMCVTYCFFTQQSTFLCPLQTHLHNSLTDCTGEVCGVTLTGTSFQYHLEGD